MVIAWMIGLAAGMANQAAASPAASPASPRVLWTVETKSNSFGGAAVADVDCDGGLDLAFGSYFGDSKVRVLRGRDGSEVWSFEAGSGGGKGDACIDASCKFADLDGDGKLELVIPISNTSQVMAFDAATGARKWTYEAGYAECIDTPPCIVDADGDGGLDVVVGTFKGRLHVIRGRDGAGLAAFKVAPGAVQSCPILLDANGDGALDLIAANFRGDDALHCVSGVAAPNGPPDARPELWRLQTGGWMYHGPAVGDLDGDGAPDLVIAAYDGKVYACRAADGTLLWTAAPGERYFMSPMAITDVDGDGLPEVIAASERVTVLRRDGTILWSVPACAEGRYEAITRGPSIADLDGDGLPDLACVNSAGLFRVYRGTDGTVLYELDCKTVYPHEISSNSHGPAIADFDGDGMLDVFFVVGSDGKDGHGMAICLTGFAGKGVGWRMLRHDLRNTGNAQALRADVP